MNAETETLSIDQRVKLLTFIVRADAVIGHGDLNPNPTTQWTDAELMALALRSAAIVGYEGRRLEQLFRTEFNIAVVTEGELGAWLAVIMLLDAERSILASAGGWN